MSKIKDLLIDEQNYEDSQDPYLPIQLFQDDENGIFELRDIGKNTIHFFEDEVSLITSADRQAIRARHQFEERFYSFITKK